MPMPLRKDGMTLLEIIVVLIIIGVACILSFPNFLQPSEKARASNVQNNLLAIYSAEQNYNNNNGGNNNYCLAACSSIAQINNVLSLQIQDDGTYLYDCSAGGNKCKATRNPGASVVITVALDQPIKIAGGVNPSCAGIGGWCP
jgi:prepilin-type N-terminal cleavage/methylation domain-containing protein